MPMVVEYLLAVQEAATFCTTAEAFTSLLVIDSAIHVDGGKIRHGDVFECDFAISSGEIKAKQQRYFHVRFSAECQTSEQIDNYSSLLKAVRALMVKVGGRPPETLWDDISFHYSREAYKLIYRVENLMRKLIANFMLVKVGAEWINESAPTEVKEVIAKSKRKEYLNVLHTIDFIHLADFLLRPYSNTSAPELIAKLEKASTLDDLHALQACAPQSNWSRYFSAIVACDDGFLKKRWEELYDLRCKVAHNAIVIKADYERIVVLVQELQVKLDEAIMRLPQVNVPQSEVEQIAEDAATRISERIGQFILCWKELEQRILKIASVHGDPGPSFQKAVQLLHENGKLYKDQLDRALWLSRFRNHVVHSTGDSPEREEIVKAVRDILELIELVRDTDDPTEVDRGNDHSS